MSDNYSPEHKAGGSFLSDSTYDVAKFMAVIVLPAFGTLYFALASIWGLPKAEEVVGTVVAIDAFLGMVLQISNRQYQNSDEKYDGKIVVRDSEPDEDGIVYTSDANLTIDANAIVNKNELIVKVDRE